MTSEESGTHDRFTQPGAVDATDVADVVEVSVTMQPGRFIRLSGTGSHRSFLGVEINFVVEEKQTNAYNAT